MVSIDLKERVTRAKVVVVGPAHAGKRTILEWLHAGSLPGHKRSMRWASLGQDHVLSVEWVWPRSPMNLCLDVCTVPGEVFNRDDLGEILVGADAVVFVADSHPRRLDEDQESLELLDAQLRERGLDPETLERLYLWNKRDLPHAESLERMEALLNPHGRPSAACVAISGDGLKAAFEGLVSRLVAGLDQEYGLAAPPPEPVSVAAPDERAAPASPLTKAGVGAARGPQLNLAPPAFRRRQRSAKLTAEGALTPSGVALTGAMLGDAWGGEGATFERSATVRYFSQMYSERTYPLLVILSQQRIQQIVMDAVEQVRSDQTLTIKEENPFLNIRLLLPGCLISPNEQDLDVSASIAEARFWVTPLAIGEVEEAKLEIRYEGKLVDTIRLPLRITRQTLAKLSASTSLASPAIKPLLGSESFQQALSGVGADVSEQAVAWISTHGVWPVAATFACLALGFFLWFKPRKAEPLESFFSLQEEPS